MGNGDKRKGRLNKTGTGVSSDTTFIGFGAFAAASSSSTSTSSPSPSPPPVTTTTSTTADNDDSSAAVASYSNSNSNSNFNTSASNNNNNNNNNSNIKFSPVYTGNDSILSVLFPKIGQKRDSKTKSKALFDLKDFFLENDNNEKKMKKIKVEALSHFLYLYKTKLAYDNSSKVRALCIQICYVASQIIPKAWNNLVVLSAGSGSGSGSAGSGGGKGGVVVAAAANNDNVEILGVILCSIADPSSDVRTASIEFISEIAQTQQKAIEEESKVKAKASKEDSSSLLSEASLSSLAYNNGIWMYSKRILSYNTSYDMYQDLFQKKGIGGIGGIGNGNGNGNGGGGSNKPIKLSEEQKEELEERYERIVGTTIEGLRLYLIRLSSKSVSKSEPKSESKSEFASEFASESSEPAESEVEDDNNNDNANSNSNAMTTPVSVKYLWKTFSSHKAALRRQTYTLLSTVCSSQLNDNNNKTSSSSQPSSSSSSLLLLPKKYQLIDCDKMCKLLVQSINSEKESINIGILLETLLTFIVSFYPLQNDERSNIMMKYFYKPLSKLFKKGCYNSSPASLWTPTILPLVALLPSYTADGEVPPRIDLLTNVWEGKNHGVVSIVDNYEIIRAVAETSAFLLAAKDDHDQGTSNNNEFDTILAQCWMNSLRSYLSFASSNSSTKPAIKKAHNELGKTLGQGWVQLDRASSRSGITTKTGSPKSKIYHIRDWFWNEELSDVIGIGIGIGSLLPQQDKGKGGKETGGKTNSNININSNSNNNLTILLQEVIHYYSQQIIRSSTSSSSTTNTNATATATAIVTTTLWQQQQQQQYDQHPSPRLLYAAPTLGKKFLDLVKQQQQHQQQSNNDVKASPSPQQDVYKLWIVILKLIPSHQIFDADNNNDKNSNNNNNNEDNNVQKLNLNLDEFVMKHLLTWIVFHTSTTLSSSGDNNWIDKNLAVLDIILLHHLSLQLVEVEVNDSNNNIEEEASDGEDGQLFQKWWNPILREILSAQPDLEILIKCIGYLYNINSNKSGSGSEGRAISTLSLLSSSDLDSDPDDITATATGFSDFCIDVARNAVAVHATTTSDIHNDDDDDENYHKTSQFLQACVGISDIINNDDEPLIEQSVVNEWIDCACIHSEVAAAAADGGGGGDTAAKMNNNANNNDNPVLDTLVVMILRGNKLLEQHEQRQRVLLQSWRQGGRLWDENIIPWLLHNNANERYSLIHSASIESKKNISELLSLSVSSSLLSPDDNLNSIVDIASIWTDCAYRLLQLCRNDDDDDDDDVDSVYDGPLLPLPSLSIIGLGDISLWEGGEEDKYQQQQQRDDSLCFCLLQLIRRMDLVSNRRWELFVNSSASPETETMVDDNDNDNDGYTLNLFVTILINLSNRRSNNNLSHTDAALVVLESDLARRRQDMSAVLLDDILFTRNFDNKLKLDTITCCISNLSLRLSKSKGKRICQSIAVLSQLIQARFVKSLRPSFTSTTVTGVTAMTTTTATTKGLDPSDVQVGDKIGYITDGNKPSVQESCVIVKIHKDLPEEVYFTIRMNRNGIEQERQTLGERLRIVRSPTAVTDNDDATTKMTSTITLDDNDNNEKLIAAVDEICDDEKKEREHITEQIIAKLIKPIIDDDLVDSCYYELYNIVITQCGLLENRRGIGSLHYFVVQQLVKLQQTLLTTLSSAADADADADTATDNSDNTTIMVAPALWRIAYALGFGMNVPASKWAIQLVGIDSAASDSIRALLAYEDYNDGEGDDTTTTKDIDCAMTVWLSVCTPACIEDHQLRNQSFSLLFQLAGRLFDQNEVDVVVSEDEGAGDGFDSNHYIALRAIEVGQAESHKFKQGESILQDSETEAITELIKAFSTQWKSSNTKEGNSSDIFTVKELVVLGASSTALTWNTLPVFHYIMENTLRERPNLMAIASRQCMDALATCLYDPRKQYYAMMILQTFAETGRPLFQVGDSDDNNDDDDLINTKTLERIDIWSQDLLQDEADELEDDIASVARWVCKDLMNDMESWQDDDDVVDDNIVCGRMLSWLSILSLADAATAKDSTNRLAFTSYVSKCEAIDSMLNLAMIYCNIGSDRKVKMDIVVPMENILLQDHNVSSSSGSSFSLSKLASRVIFRSVEVFPTLSKNWWDSSCPTYLTQIVREFVETQVSPDILKHAVKSIKNTTAFGEMKTSGSSVSREVTATYVQDDFTLSVVIKLPLSFPFRRAEVDCSKTLGVPESRWKRWSLQITQMLNNQGGTLKDALLLWKENVDKEFEGIEPCPVCYSVLHVKSHKLPNMECKTCHNHFHSDCLFEWFKSSGKSACVICQQPWSGTRI